MRCDDIGQEIFLWHCCNVSEVITWYQTHPTTFSSWDGQWHYTDTTGAGVVVILGVIIFLKGKKGKV